MKYAIIGAGNIGTALARLFAREHLEIALANTHGAASLAPLASELGTTVHPQSMQEALSANVIFLAVPFSAHPAVAAQLPDWTGKIVVDVTNALHVAPEELKGRLSSEIVASAFTGARLVKAFNHLPAGQLGASARQAIFVASNEAEASATIAALATRLGFVAIELGRLDQGGVPLHIVGGKPGGLVFQNLVKPA